MVHEPNHRMLHSRVGVSMLSSVTPLLRPAPPASCSTLSRCSWSCRCGPMVASWASMPPRPSCTPSPYVRRMFQYIHIHEICNIFVPLCPLTPPPPSHTHTHPHTPHSRLPPNLSQVSFTQKLKPSCAIAFEHHFLLQLFLRAELSC
jgi:hypothetical protein